MTHLATRLRDAATTLSTLQALLDAKPGALPTQVLKSFQDITDWRADLLLWCDAVEARDGAEAMLAGLENRVDDRGRVLIGGAEMSFAAARLLGTQAWVSMQWALTDRVTDFVGRVVCVDPDKKDNKGQSFGAKMVAEFLIDGKSAPLLQHAQLRHCFGWPVAVAYALRNHIAHDAGVRSGSGFFASNDPSAPFEVSARGMADIEGRAKGYRVESSHTRLAQPWPWGQADARVLLSTCHGELDEALGLLLVGGLRSFEGHVGFLLGEL